MKKLIILMAVCTGSYAMAQNNTSDPSGSGTSGRVENQTSDFIKKAAMIDKMEIAAGKIAQEKALNPQVKSFGDMMISEHTKSSVELRTLAGKKNITLPAEHGTMSSVGSSSEGYMGAQGQNSNYNSSATNNRTRTESYNSSRGNANSNLPISQTTPSTKYSEGTQTNWNSKDVNKTSRRPNTSGSSGSSSTYNNGQRMNRDATNTNRTTADEMTMSTEIRSSGTNSATQNAGIETNGTIKSGTASGTMNTGTTNGTINSGTNNSNMDTGTSSTTGNTGTTSGTMNSGSTTGSLNTGTGINTQEAGIGMNNDMNMTQMQDDHMNKLGTLSGMNGEEFDRAYMDMMVSDHTKAIQLYESASRSSDAEISAFATRMLPALRKHFEQAKSISTTVKTSSSGL